MTWRVRTVFGQFSSRHPPKPMRRARSRLGEDRYRLLTNNCEHFCEWCLRDEHRSYQVESLLALPRQMARVCGEVITRILNSVTCAAATNDRTAD